jgi:hypothetical protein
LLPDLPPDPLIDLLPDLLPDPQPNLLLDLLPDLPPDPQPNLLIDLPVNLLTIHCVSLDRKSVV